MNASLARESYRYKIGPSTRRRSVQADPTITEIVRHSLCSAAGQMKRSLMRTAFSPIIYDAHDFAVALYDPQMRLLAQAPSIPAFMGTLSFCVEEALRAVGNIEALEPGDVLVYNVPYGTGSHAQDVAMVTPVFHRERLVGYAVNKAHQLDIGAKNAYCTDTTDVFQEGLKLPGVKLFRRGELNEDVMRIAIANSRAPQALQGDLHAQVASARTGAAELVRLIERFGTETFESAVERMYDQSEAAVRAFFEKIPDGRYVGRSFLDDNGVDTDPIEFEVAIEVSGSAVYVDFSQVPDAQRGPVNCPFPSTVSATRVSILALAGGPSEPNEGFFRPVEIITRPGSMFHPQSPAPCYLYGWAIMPAMEAIYRAFAQASPDLAPAGGAGDICHVGAVGRRPGSSDIFYMGSALPVGQGAHARGDGATLFVPGLSNTRLQSAELQESKYPVRFRRIELVPDSAGDGKFRGGLGFDYVWEALADVSLISTIERTREPAWGIAGGSPGKPNGVELQYPDGSRRKIGKVTDLTVPAGTLIYIRAGGGGGFGPPAERSALAVARDIDEGYLSEAHARATYPHAFRMRLEAGHKPTTGGDMANDGEVVLAAFQNFFAAFMGGSIDELLQQVALPYFDLRGRDLVELRTEAQLDGFRRGLRARMTSLGFASGTLTTARVLHVDQSLALIQFDNARNAADGTVAGAASSLAYLKQVAGVWRVWMITVIGSSGAAGAPS